MTLNVTFQNQSNTNKYQREIVELFNSLIKKKKVSRGALDIKKLFSNTQNDIDNEHEIDDKVRLKLEDTFKRIPNNTINANAPLTSGPFEGKSLLWVACYIGASRYTFLDADDQLNEGYSYILGKLLDKAIPSSIDFNVEFKINGSTFSALWLAMNAHLKTVSTNGMWIVDEILKLLSTEELLKLDFNNLSTKEDRVAVSPLTLIIQSEISLLNRFDQCQNFMHRLLKKVPPRNYPKFYNFNAPVLDLGSLGMTTLCLAAKGDADLIQTKVISFNSPFISILKAADLSTLNFKAKILKGTDQGKTPLWYAAYMLDEDEECFKLIIENANFEQLEFNDKPEDPQDKQANKSVLWFASHDYAVKKDSKHLHTIFAKSKDLSKLDFNNGPSSPKDKHAGQTVLWNLGKAALASKGEPFIRALKLGKVVNLDYSAREQHGGITSKSVLGLALTLAMKNNFTALNLILQNIQTFGLNADAIQGYELEMLCHLAKRNHLYPLEILLPYIKMKPEYLNREVPTDKSGKNVVFLLIELAWQGYPHFLKMALQDINIDNLALNRKVINPNDRKVISELNAIVKDISRYDGPADLPQMPILQGFIDSGHDELTEQLKKLSLSSTSQADIMDFKAISAPMKQLTAQFNLSQNASKKSKQHGKSMHKTKKSLKINK